jgi:preprotein translocase subunit YajC
MHGKIVAVEDATVVLEVDKGIRLTFEKTAIASERSGAPTAEVVK